MKRYVVYGIVILLAAGSLYMAFAATDSNMPMGRRGMGMGKGMMQQGMMPQGCPICMAVMQKQMVATEDGGIVFTAFGQIMKFDKDLNLVKTVDIPFDAEKMEAKMKTMMEKCPMCKMMKEKMQSAGSEGGM